MGGTLCTTAVSGAERGLTDPECPAAQFCREHYPFQAGTSWKKEKQNKKTENTALCSKRNKNTSAKIRNCWFGQKEGGEEKSPNILPLVRAADPQSPCGNTAHRQAREGKLRQPCFFPAKLQAFRPNAAGLGENKEALFDQMGENEQSKRLSVDWRKNLPALRLCRQNEKPRPFSPLFFIC